MGKKKFIDKKKAATFTLVYRESEAEDITDVAARVFTRVDGGEGYVKGFSDSDPKFHGQSSDYTSGNGDERRYAFGEGSERDVLNFDRNTADSKFDDADDESGEEAWAAQPSTQTVARKNHSQKRLESIELGFPDDGYDYLQHLRKIGTPGVLGAFVPAARIDPNALRADVKAYDASKVQVQPRDEDSKEGERSAIELVRSSTHLVRKPLSKEGVLDADILAALEDSDDSRFDSADELEDEFVILANDGVEVRSTSANGASGSGPSHEGGRSMKLGNGEEEFDDDDVVDDVDELALPRKDRPARFLDEQFETLALREYDEDEFGELDADDPTTRGHADISEFSSVLSEYLTEKVNFKERYETPAEENKKEGLSSPLAASEAIRGSSYKDSTSSMIIHSGVDDVVVKKTLEYTSDDEREVVLESASDDEKEHWDCETIVSTLPNLDNHPGKIRAPGPVKPTIKLQDMEKSETGIIRLGGKQKLPLDYLPRRAVAPVKEEAKPVSSKPPSSLGGKKAGPRVGETLEEKRARKAAVKEERREARVGKKALKLMYRQDAQRAQRGAAVTGPSSIHLP